MIGSRKMVPSRMLRMVPFGRAPHLLQVEFLDARLVGRDGGALDAHAVLLDRVGRVDRDLVVGLVAVLDAEVVVLQVDVEVRQDQLLAMNCQMMRVISSPSSSTTGFFTLILSCSLPFRQVGRPRCAACSESGRT
jgi:hypothetical protein